MDSVEVERIFADVKLPPDMKPLLAVLPPFPDDCANASRLRDVRWLVRNGEGFPAVPTARLS